MKAIRIPLKPHSHFHFGEFKVDSNVALSSTSEHAHSDTLFSALINTYADANGDASSLVKEFKDENIVISSLFYYIKREGKIVYLFPKPLFLDLYSPRDGNHKLRRKVKMVSLGVWESGFDTQKWTEPGSNNYRFIQNQDIVITTSEFTALGLNPYKQNAIFHLVDIPKSPVRKYDPDEAIYYQSDIEIAYIENVEIGFWFLTAFHPRLEKKIRNMINRLVFSGIGGEKNNTGRIPGEPVFEEANFHIEMPAEDKRFNFGYSNLSLLIPKNGQELSGIPFFQTLLRGGRTTGIEELKAVRMIKEGSLLNSENIRGTIVQIGTHLQNHPVLRYGKSINVPIKYKTQYD